MTVDHRCRSCCATFLPNRRSIVAGFVCAVAVSAASPLLAQAVAAQDVAPPPSEDERFMRIAIDEARQGDFPFGAVIVRDKNVLARGRNLGRTTDDPTAHGEMVAMRRALAEHGSRALRGATLYTSGEPCAMCMGAILWCEFGRLVYAASIEQLATRLNQIMIASVELRARAPFVAISITGGVLADEAMALFPNNVPLLSPRPARP